MHHVWYRCGLNMRLLFIIHSPAVSKLIKTADNCPVWFCVLIIGASIIISTQSLHTRSVYTGQRHHLGGRQTERNREFKLNPWQQQCISMPCADVHLPTCLGIAVKAHRKAKVSWEHNKARLCFYADAACRRVGWGNLFTIDLMEKNCVLRVRSCFKTYGQSPSPWFYRF